MIKDILIPTDYTVESLNLVKAALKNNIEEKQNLILISGFRLPTSITELLFFSKEEKYAKLMSLEFKEALTILINKYSQSYITVSFELFTGSTQNSFQTLLEANNIKASFISKAYKMKFKDANCFDVTRYIKKSKIKTEEVSWIEHSNLPEKDKASELFSD